MIELLTPIPQESLRQIERDLEITEGIPTTFDPAAVGYTFMRDGEPFLTLVFDSFYFCGNMLISTAMTVVGDLKNVGRGVLYLMSFIPFYVLGAMRCIVAAKGNNQASLRAIEKYGFVLEGVFEKAADGVNDVYCYRLTAEESNWLTDRGAIEASKIKYISNV